MKRLMFILFVALNISNLVAQDYVPMAVDHATWLMGSTYEDPQFDEWVVLRLEGDTVVNSLTYSKIYHYESMDYEILVKTKRLLGLLRDDLNERKVYGGFLDEMQDEFQTFLKYGNQCDWGGSNVFSERLLYDFDVTMSDSIYSCMLPSAAGITAIDTIERYGFSRRNLMLDDEDSTIMTEGIGTCLGIFKGEECFFTGGGLNYALFNYCIGSFENCNLLTSIQENSFEEQAVISPNPVSDILFISSTSDFLKVSLFDIQGKLVESFGGVEQIDMSSYRSGLYILVIQGAHGKSYAQKVMKY